MTELPRLRTPKEIAGSLGCSEWWVKERARRREIPFVRVGGAYRFKDEHLAEILEIFEQRPEAVPGAATVAPRRRTQARPAPTEQVVPLRARQPRRPPKAG